ARIVYLKELDQRGFVVYSNWGSREGKGGQVFGDDQGRDGHGLGAMPVPGDGDADAELAQDARGNKWAALTFCWASVERQVRVEGLLEPLPRDESEVYWRTRERGSQIGAWASWQSRVLWSAEQSELVERRKSHDKGPADVSAADLDETDVDDGRAVLEQRVKEMRARFAGSDKIPLPPFWGGVRLVPESVEFWQGRRSRLHDRFRTTAAETASSLESSNSRFLELFIRALCLALNTTSNVIMWALFTRALTASPSTTKVSITNTAANFVLTALLGGAVFGESLPRTWWVGAGLMGVGCVLVGMREES
ncbi:pyridoxamine phosphate oxidase, partial [Aspergillus sp. HF37]